MADFYSVRVETNIGILADSESEAQAIAERAFSEARIDMPREADRNLRISAYRTPNQEDYLKRGAINYDPLPDWESGPPVIGEPAVVQTTHGNE